MGIKRLKSNIKEYDFVILCGPIWMGKFIPPLRSFVRRYHESINKLIFVTCCGSTYKRKDEKFGHGMVFKEVETMLKHFAPPNGHDLLYSIISEGLFSNPFT